MVSQVRAPAAVLPQQVQPIVADQLQSVSSNSAGALGFGLVGSLLAALWSASREAMDHCAVGSFATAIIAQVEQTVLDKVLKRRRLRWTAATMPVPRSG